MAEAVKPKYGGNRHITVSAHQGGNFTAVKLPTITLVFPKVVHSTPLQLGHSEKQIGTACSKALGSFGRGVAKAFQFKVFKTIWLVQIDPKMASVPKTACLTAATTALNQPISLDGTYISPVPLPSASDNHNSRRI